MPKLNINEFRMDYTKDWKKIYQSIPSKALHEYTIDDIHAEENADFLIEILSLLFQIFNDDKEI